MGFVAHPPRANVMLGRARDLLVVVGRIEVYERQLKRWRALSLTAGQRAEVDRLAGELGPWRAIVQMTLDLAAELKGGTIDSIMRTDDAQLGLEVLLGLRPLP